MRTREGWYDPDVLEAISAPGADGEEAKEVKTLHVRELQKGMELLDDVVDVNGRLLVAHGQEVSSGLLERLSNFSENVGLKEPLRVLVDK